METGLLNPSGRSRTFSQKISKLANAARNIVGGRYNQKSVFN